MSDEHLDLKIDLGRKINAILQAEHVAGLSFKRTTGAILDLLELESQESFLTRGDAAQLWAEIADLQQATLNAGIITGLERADTAGDYSEAHESAHQATSREGATLGRLISRLKRGDG